MDSQYIAIGRVSAPWGTHGELKVEVLTDFPQRFSPQRDVWVNHKTMTIEGCRWHRSRAILKLVTIDTADDAEKLRGQFLQVPQSQISPLAENEYYHFQILGLDVWTSDNKFLGKIERIISTGSNDVYVVTTEDGEALIPSIEDVVKSVDLDAGRVTVEPIEGLLPKKVYRKQGKART
jgi:16S rRNA processing protein RimM